MLMLALYLNLTVDGVAFDDRMRGAVCVCHTKKAFMCHIYSGKQFDLHPDVRIISTSDNNGNPVKAKVTIECSKPKEKASST